MIVVLWWGCRGLDEDITPPSVPRWVEKSVPYAWEETGIDAENTGEQNIKLHWYHVDDEDLAGYEIFRRAEEDSGDFEWIRTVDRWQAVGADTVYFDPEPELGKRYLYFMRSEDTEENSSDPSDTIGYMLLDPPGLISPVNTTTGGRPTFAWQTFSTGIYWANYFSIRVEDVTDPDDVSTVWTCFLLNNWIGQQGPITFDYVASDTSAWPENVLACNYRDDRLSPGVFRWKVKGIFTIDEFERDESSGVSEWGFFEVE